MNHVNKEHFSKPRGKVTIIILSVFSTILLALAIVFGSLWGISRNDKYNYDLQLDNTSKERLDNGIWSSSKVDIQAIIYTNDTVPLDEVYNCVVDSGNSYCEINQSSDDPTIFTINTLDYDSTNPYEEVEATLSADISGFTLSYDFFFTIYPITSEYTANSTISIYDGTTTTSDYDDFSESAIGNIPIYTLVGSDLKDEGTPIVNFYAVVTSTNEDCFHIIKNADPNSYSIQILDKGSSIIAIDYYSNNSPRSLLHIQKTWALDNTDIANASVFSNDVIKSEIPYGDKSPYSGEHCEYTIELNGYQIDNNQYEKLSYYSHTNYGAGSVKVDASVRIIKFYNASQRSTRVYLTANTRGGIEYKLPQGANGDTSWLITP